MEVEFGTAPIPHPTKFEGILQAINNFNAAITSELVNVPIYIETTVSSIDSSVTRFYSAIINTTRSLWLELAHVSLVRLW